jgi:hypothetical protein
VAAHSEPVGGGAMPAGAAEAPSPLPASCERTRLFTAGGTPVWQITGQKAFFFTAGLAIDADGAPDAYHPNDTGRDFLANAGRPGNWWAPVTDTGTASGAALPAHFG